MTWDELKDIDVGTRFSGEFKGTTIPTLEEALEYIEDDELVEVTPKSIRLRKRILSDVYKRQGVECTNAYGLHPNSGEATLGEMVRYEADAQSYTVNQMFIRDMISHAAENVPVSYTHLPRDVPGHHERTHPPGRRAAPQHRGYSAGRVSAAGRLGGVHGGAAALFGAVLCGVHGQGTEPCHAQSDAGCPCSARRAGQALSLIHILA